MRALLCGSYAYGTPTEESDIDLLVRVSPKLKAFLLENSEATDSARFGKLNLILASTDEEYELWRDGIDACKKQKPLGSSEVRVLFDHLRLARDITAKYKEEDNG